MAEQIANIMSILEKNGGKIFMLDFWKNESRYELYLSIWWIIIVVLLYFATFNINSSQTIFTIYCCNVWIFLLAILFLFNIKRLQTQP
jgi:hypothetical protein